MERDLQEMAYCIYSIPFECDRSYISKTGRPLAMQLHEFRHNLKEGLLEKSKLSQNVYKEDHRVGRDEAWMLETESNSSNRNYMESVHMDSPLSAMRLITKMEGQHNVRDSSWVSAF
jgi:hypothetical protein